MCEHTKSYSSSTIFGLLFDHSDENVVCFFFTNGIVFLMISTLTQFTQVITELHFTVISLTTDSLHRPDLIVINLNKTLFS